MQALFTTAARIITGAGSLSSVGEEAKSLGKRALVLTGRRAMKEAGIEKRLLDILSALGVESHLFDRVPPEPDLTVVDEARCLIRKHTCDLVIGLGGGSVIDVAKAAGGLANEEAPAAAFHQGKKVEKGGLPIIAIPTTSGTGTEVTRNSVIIDKKRRVKKSIRDDALMPRVAIIDPELTLTLPPEVTAYTGMDALTQAIESFTSIHSTPLTDALAFKAFGLLSQSLLQAVKDGKDLEARTDMSYGSLLAGMALANARLGAVHGLAHPLGVRYDIAHGMVCGILLPFVMHMNLAFAKEKYRALGEAVNQDVIAWVEKTSDEAGLPKDLSNYNLRKEDFPEIMEEALQSGSTAANPKKVTQEDLLKILRDLRGTEAKTSDV
ncbi:MAG: hypothetical protein AMS15_04965 [Planctomycetes bacterium DG_23]|nr:MAG: hypothetical protein AMS15_04965 [Planctomycetes bacterium DG_23]